jgi:glycosyltransferase involved in cell wall biosynthesis
MTGVPVAQRAVIVVPTTAEFDSRTFRVATALAARGHTVTVIGRADGRLPRDETAPGGYRILRVPVSSIDGLPLPAAIRRRMERRRAAARAAAAHPGTAGPSGEPELATASRGRLRRIVAASTRLAAIALTVRSQARRSRRVDPGGDVYHAMAYMGIPVGLDLARRSGGRAVYDARDIYTDAHNMARLPRPARRLFGWIERRWARRSAAIVTVNRPYAEVMAERWDVPLPAIILNCASLAAVSGSRTRRFHEHLGLDPGVAVVLYQGGFSRERGIEQLVTAIGDVPGAVLVLMGYGTLRGELDAIAADPATGGRIRVVDAVPPADLIDWVAAADVVAMPIQPSTLNHRLTTPNKLFEAMAAGVPVVASDLPGMAPIVRETGCGLVCDPTDPDAIAAALRAILEAPAEERAAYGERALAAVRTTYHWEAQMEHLLAVYERLTGRPW